MLLSGTTVKRLVQFTFIQVSEIDFKECLAELCLIVLSSLTDGSTIHHSKIAARCPMSNCNYQWMRFPWWSLFYDCDPCTSLTLGIVWPQGPNPLLFDAASMSEFGNHCYQCQKQCNYFIKSSFVRDIFQDVSTDSTSREFHLSGNFMEQYCSCSRYGWCCCKISIKNCWSRY